MSTVARPKKSRRREYPVISCLSGRKLLLFCEHISADRQSASGQRTRKKRGPVTIESIIPGRVPVGFLPTDLEAAPYLAVDSSLTGRSSEGSGASPAPVSSHSQLSIQAPVPEIGRAHV